MKTISIKLYVVTCCAVLVCLSVPSCLIHKVEDKSTQDPESRVCNMMTIHNPYAGIDWTNVRQVKAALHNHTENTNEPIGEWHDGVSGTVAQRVAAYTELGFGILVITDHDYVSWPWSNFGVTNSSLITFPGNELSKNTHMLSYFCSYYDNKGAGPSVSSGFKENIKAVGDLGGIMVIAHPNRGGATQDPAFTAELLREFPHIVGLEVLNAGQFGKNYSAAIWDHALSELMPERDVWAFGSNDAHHVSAQDGNGFTWIILAPEVFQASEEEQQRAVRASIEKGWLFASSWCVEPFVDDKKTQPSMNGHSIEVPAIVSIAVDQQHSSIRLATERADNIEWISSGGKVIANGSLLERHQTPDAKTYVRARLLGPGGQTLTQPFGLLHSASMN